ncbi:hypothetical protein [Streptomyces corynorhini]|uniref:N-acetyltransferase domain-containing protein n=1 Tax=Streptomyces corynorhini TaxID=2282652 RepID=A0A370AV88_9ACTN|nr:hypothetical protein [Streptomyces corynorhini]RDG32049.1 hypothetical protein DVH02_32900 [Streptomyces corynorhini]
MTVSAAYLVGAREAGLLARYDELPFVAGEYEEPVRKEPQWLVTYCDPALTRLPSWWSALPGLARAAVPRARSVVLRAPADAVPPAPWRRLVTYLRYDGVPASAGSGDGDCEVLPAVPAHDGPIRRWLTMALSAAAVSHGAPAGHTADPSFADTLLNSPGRLSFVAAQGGEAIGHATLLCDAEDEVTGRAHVELFDILVEAGDADRRNATGVLVAAAARHAAGLGLPLFGNVVHTPAAEADPGEAVVTVLGGQGWRVDHVLWERPLFAPDSGGGVPSPGGEAAR